MRFFFFAVFAALSIFTSCSTSVSESEGDSDEEPRLYSVSGTISLKHRGASPRTRGGKKARTAIPSLSDNELYSTVKATNGKDTYEADVEENASGKLSFKITLPEGTWTFSASSYSDEAHTEQVLRTSEDDSIKEKISGDTSIAIQMVPVSSGSGSVKLPVTVDNSVNKMTFTSDNGKLNGEKDFSSETDWEISTEGIESGSYPVEFRFYDRSGALIYSFTETVNVYPNMETDTWNSSGKYISGGKISITEELIASFQSSSFFVSPTKGKRTNRGGFFDPFDSISTAMHVIKDTLCSGEYTVYLMEDLTANEEIDLSKVSKTLSLEIKSCDQENRSIKSKESKKSVLAVTGNSSSKVKLTGLEISGADSVEKGGGICIENAAVILEDCVVKGNKATNGAGVYIKNGTLALSGTSTIGDDTKTESANSTSGSNSATSGGGVYAESSKVLIGYTDESAEDENFTGGIFGNYALFGGGIYTAGESTIVKMSGGEISLNGSGSDGGGLRMGGTGDSFFMGGGKMLKNAANTEGTGNGGGGVYIGNASEGAFVEGGEISRNTAYAGGGIMNNGSGTVELSSSARVEANTATTTGGGIHSAGTVVMSGSASVTGNTASEGGGIFVRSGKLLIGYTDTEGEIRDESFSGEITGNSGGIGGGVNSSIESPVIKMSGGTVSGNKSEGWGGGFYLGGGTEFTLYGGVISGNEAAEQGGGIYIDTNAAATLTGGTIKENTADTCGSGIYQGGELYMNGSAVVDSGNDIYLPFMYYIYLQDGFSTLDTDVAKITPQECQSDLEILREESTSMNLVESFHGKFGITAEYWSIGSDGRLKTTISKTGGVIDGMFYQTEDEFVKAVSDNIKNGDEATLTLGEDATESILQKIADAMQNKNESKITLDLSYTKIEEIKQQFQNRQWLLRIIMPTSLTTIGENAFSNSQSILEISFPIDCKLVSIGANAFNQASKLSSIEIPSLCETIGDGAFLNCTSLESVKFVAGSSLEKIGADAFKSTIIESIEFPSGLKCIGAGAFQGISKLETATFLNTDSWKITSGETVKVSEYSVSDAAENAECLKRADGTHYADCEWRRNE